MRVVVTAGPTREPIDPVRYVTNRSSGRMGFALARAARRAGHEVTLVAGPVALRTPKGVRRVDATTAEEMLAAVLEAFRESDGLVMAAAPADWRPAGGGAARKLKKRDGPPVEAWEPTPDILRAAAAEKRPGQWVVGFAAETENLEAEALGKLRRKRLDAIVANDVSCADCGMGAAENAVAVYGADGLALVLPRMGKDALARRLWRWIETAFSRRSG